MNSEGSATQVNHVNHTESEPGEERRQCEPVNHVNRRESEPGEQ